MLTSAWPSEVIEDQSQHRYMDGYARRDMNSVNSVNSMSTAMNGKKGNYYASPAYPPTPTYSKPSQSGDVDSSSTFGNTNATNNVMNRHATKNGKKGNYHSPTTASPISPHPSAFQSGEIDSGLTRTNTMGSVGDMAGMNSGPRENTGKPSNYQPAITEYPTTTFQSNEIHSGFTPNQARNMNGMQRVNLDTVRSGKETNYHSPSTAPPNPEYPGAFKSGEIDSSFTSNSTRISNGMDRVNNIDTAKSGKKSNYQPSTAARAIAEYPTNFQSNENDTSVTLSKASNMNGMNRANGDTAKNAKKNNYRSHTASPATASSPNAFQSGEIDSDFTPTNTGITNSTNRINTVNMAKNGKKSNYNLPAVRPAVGGYSGVIQSNDIASSFPPSIRSTKTTTNRANNIDTAKSAHKESYHSSKERPAIPGYPSAFEDSDISLSSSRNHSHAVNSMDSVNNVNSVSTAYNGKKQSHRQPTAASPTPKYQSSFQSSGNGRSSNSIAAAWEEHVDEITNRKYFYNGITGMSTWGEPNALVKRPPPPPPSPPPISLIIEKREQDHWFKIASKKGRRMWYNDITQRTQVERPDCLRKYK